MEKLEYECGNDWISYPFPAYRWYENKKKKRSVMLYLKNEDKKQDALDADICLRIREGGKRKVTIRMDDEQRARLFFDALSALPFPLHSYPRIILADGEETEAFAAILEEISDNANELTVLTKTPGEYEAIFEHIYDRTGLLPMTADRFFKEEHLCPAADTPRYKRTKYRDGRTLILWAEYNGKLPIREFPKESTFFDFSFHRLYEKEITVKRSDINYCGLGQFLDTVVKSRYNTLVKEGKLHQCVIIENHKKPFGKRKET